MAGSGPKYPDLRYLFMRGLIQHERSQRSRHYLKSAAECTSRAIVSLELSQEPVKTIKQARKLEAIGGETCAKLTKLETERNFSFIRPLGGRFVSSAGGILVAMLEINEQLLLSGHRADKPVLIPERKVRERAELFTEETFQSSNTEAFCPAWWRLEVLIKRGYIKRRSMKKAPVLQLLPLGTQVAQMLRERNGLPPVTAQDLPRYPNLSPVKVPEKLEFDDPDPGERTPQNPGMITAPAYIQEGSLYTNDTGADGLVLLIDTQEMGGERNGLGELCGLISRRGMVYHTKKLKSGDYSWVWRCRGQDIVLPCLVERKRADDLSGTLFEGRLWSQVAKMVEWSSQFADQGLDCRLYYVLERRPEEYVVKCTDGCQGIGQCGNPTLTQIKHVIEDLKRQPELLVRETDSLETTVILLASLTAELNDSIAEGKFDALLHKAITGNTEDLGRTPAGGAVKPKAEPTTQADRRDFRPTLAAETVTKHSVLPEGMKVENLTFDEELALVLEMSKKETCAHDLSRNSRVLDKDQSVERNAEKRTDYDVNWNIKDESGQTNPASSGLYDEDQAIAAAIERSKLDSYNAESVRTNETRCEKALGMATATAGDTRCEKALGMATATAGDTSLPFPLMQYHCSAGGSVTYPHTPGYRSNTDQHSYRPKMNRSKTTVRSNSTVTSERASHYLDDKVTSDITSRYLDKQMDNSCTTHDKDNIKVDGQIKSGCRTSNIGSIIQSPFHCDMESSISEKENIRGEQLSNISVCDNSRVAKLGSAFSPYCDDKVVDYPGARTSTPTSRKHKLTTSGSSKSATVNKRNTNDMETSVSIVGHLSSDSESGISEPLRTRPKKKKLCFTPCMLNTQPEPVKPMITKGKKTRGKRKGKKSSNSEIDCRQDDVGNIDSSVSSNTPRLSSPNKFSCSLVEMEEGDSNLPEDVCDSLFKAVDADGKSVNEEQLDGNRSDEDLFPEYADVGVASHVNEDSLEGKPDNELEERDSSPSKSSQETSNNQHDSSFSSTHSCSHESLPDLAHDIDMKDDGVETSHSSTAPGVSHKPTSHKTETQNTSSEADFHVTGTGSVKTPSKKDDKVRMVLSVLPHISESAVLSTLKTCGGDVELCVSVLLEA